tara:strand:+ start:215 stop:1213 length:999 start_codon:yes stop_codon:yes gene_type:complete
MKIIKLFLAIYFFIFLSPTVSSDTSFEEWLFKFKIKAQNEGISKKTINTVLDRVVFIPKVIEYDRYQPEFYEDTITYINKRVTNSKIKNGSSLYKNKKDLIDRIEKKFSVEKELLLALMGIETNFGTYLGKMDILSSLATLSYDKRRSSFFTNELIVLLKLIDNKKVDPSILYGSWAGAFGNFQFMPTTISKYAIDYDSNSIIELKMIDDSFASAANYINQMGWKTNEPCFYKINLDKNIPKKYLNTSAKKIINKKKVKYFKKYITNYEELNIKKNRLAAIVTPDVDIIEDNDGLSPSYLVFKNYELILKWNRSLRFGLAVCYLKNKFENEL